MKVVADLTTAELTALVRQAVRDELAAQRPKLRVVKAPAAAKPDRVAQVRRSLRRQGVA